VRRKPSIRRFRMSRFSVALAAALIAVAAGLAVRPGAASSVQTAPGLIAEVVVTDVGRPIQLAFDRGGRLVVLSHGRRGDAAGEIHRLDVTQALPIDAGRAPRVVIPFSEAPRKPTLGSLAVDPRTGDLYLGEENGNRVYHLETHSRLTAVAVGLQHLVGGSSIALDGDGRLVAVDYASPETQGRAEVPPPPGLDVLTPQLKASFMRAYDRAQQNQQSVYATLFAKDMRMERAFVKAGGMLVAGTDPTWPCSLRAPRHSNKSTAAVPREGSSQMTVCNNQPPQQ